MKIGDKISFTRDDRTMSGEVCEVIAEDCCRVDVMVDGEMVRMKIKGDDLKKSAPKKTTTKKVAKKGGL